MKETKEERAENTDVTVAPQVMIVEDVDLFWY